LKPDLHHEGHEETRKTFKVHLNHDFEPRVMSLLFFVPFVIFVVKA